MGEIPPELSRLPNLDSLSLTGNSLTGRIPAALGQMARLEQIYLGMNFLTGEIPPDLGNMNRLRYLFLNNNRLTGRIPPQLGNLTNIKELYLFGNELTGEIPAELGQLASLEALRLTGNQTLIVPGSQTSVVIPFESDRMYGENEFTGCIPLGLLKIDVYTDLRYCDGSPTGRRDRTPPDSCSNGVVVRDPGENPGLVSDCEVLLATREFLTWRSQTDWETSVPITNWRGVVVGGSPSRG